jgi:hypothetical protein
MRISESLLEQTVREVSEEQSYSESRYIVDLRANKIQMYRYEIDVSGVYVLRVISFTITRDQIPLQVTEADLSSIYRDGTWQLCPIAATTEIGPDKSCTNILKRPDLILYHHVAFAKLLRPLVMNASDSGVIVLVESSQDEAYVCTLFEKILENDRMRIPLFEKRDIIVIDPTHDIRGYAFFTCITDTMLSPGNYLILNSHRSGVLATYDGDSFSYRDVTTLEQNDITIRNYIVLSGTPTEYTDPIVRILTDITSFRNAMFLGYVRWILQSTTASAPNLDTILQRRAEINSDLNVQSGLLIRLKKIFTRIAPNGNQ